MNYLPCVGAGLHMLLDVVEWHLEIATESFARTEHFSEQADFFVAFQVRKIQQLLAAIVLALVLDLLDQPGGDQGEGVAKVDHAGGALGQLLPSLLSDPVSTRAANNVAVAADGHWSSLSGCHQAHWALDQPPQLLFHVLVLLLQLLFLCLQVLLVPLQLLFLLLKSQDLLILLPHLLPEIFKLHASPSNKFPQSL